MHGLCVESPLIYFFKWLYWIKCFIFLLSWYQIFIWCPIDFMELALSTRLLPHDIWLWSWRLRDVVHVEEVLPYMLKTNIHGHETLCGFSASLEHYLLSDGWCVMIHLWPLWVVNIRGGLFQISSLSFIIAFLTQEIPRPLGERFIKMSHPRPFWNALMNISWFGWVAYMVASLN